MLQILGSCGPTVWRSDLVIPFLKKRGITYYNPQRSQWTCDMIGEEAQAKEVIDFLFFHFVKINTLQK